jgi:hypothetical protein
MNKTLKTVLGVLGFAAAGFGAGYLIKKGINAKNQVSEVTEETEDEVIVEDDNTIEAE